jgi:transcriptional regulator with XRE-family HTH domain
MPKYPINRNADFALAVTQLKDAIARKDLKQSVIASELGMSQSEISKFLTGAKKKPNDKFILLCQKVGIEYPKIISNPIDDPRIQKALNNVHDGTEESLVFIARLIECAAILNTNRSRKA